MVTDGNGRGQIIAHALLKTDRQETIKSFVSIFQELNVTAFNAKVFLVDNYLNEMAVLRSLWPESKILLCPWHVRRAFKSNISSLSLSQDKKDEIRKICEGIAYARTEEHYSILCNELEEKVPRDFHKYFLDNCHACRHMSVHCWRGSSSHMGNQNREIGLRVFTGKLKRTYTQTWRYQTVLMNCYILTEGRKFRQVTKSFSLQLRQGTDAERI